MKIKEAFSNAGSWALVSITIIGVVLIYSGLGGRGSWNTPGGRNYYVFAIGLVLILPFLFLMVKSKFQIRRFKQTEKHRIEGLLSTGMKIMVNLENLTIYTNSYLEEIEVGSGNRKHNKQIDINHNVILLEIPYKDRIIPYRVDINMDPTKLKMHLNLKAETELYVDPNNPNNHYLDLRFLQG
ncbi:hypothetical protein [Robiginitalea sediminis]|uniref:hypothetical protein n=1 Tax=Robiginitalea sediminis TaxID=1982593 RepID=UPI00117AE5C8|nr:hypothetical protein [Robiginitalea sediminis]